MAPIIKIGLQKAGIPSHVPTSLQNAPTAVMGFGIFDPYMEQRCQWVQTLMNHLWQDTPTGTLLKIALEDAQLEMGIPTHLSPQMPWKPESWFTTDSWIKQCLQFLWNFEIHVDPLGTQLHSPHTGDRALMECLTFNTQEVSMLSRLNRCRMAKQVLWLSDVFSADGSSIAPTAWDYQPMPSPFSWPLKHYVTQQDWTLWKQALCSIQQIFRLGPWRLAPEVHLDFPALYSPQSKCLYHQHTNGTWSCHFS